jgi:hypothetical protein
VVPSTRFPFTTAVKRLLDHAMVERGFAPGQGSDAPAPQRTDVIFCAALDDFERRWPLIFERVNVGSGGQLRHYINFGGCIDLTVRGSHDGVSAVDLEGVSLDELSDSHGLGPALAAGTLDDQLREIRAWIDAALPTTRPEGG